MIQDKNVLTMAVIDLIDHMEPSQVYDALRWWDDDLLLRLYNQMQEIGATLCASVLLYSVIQKVSPINFRMVTEAAQLARR
jgi:hypothetical protein